MLQNYLLVAYRTLLRDKTSGLINVGGLALGLACSFLILLWVQDELRYDRFHDDQETLFTAKRHVTFESSEITTWHAMPVPVSMALEETFPEVAHAEMVSYPEEVILAVGDAAYREQGFWAEEAFFEMFSFPLLLGDPTTALVAPDGVVLSETAATKLFGPMWQDNPVLGRTVRVDSRLDATVTGVFADVPTQSSLQFDLVLPAAEFYERKGWLLEDWSSSFMQLFVQLQPGTNAEALASKLDGFIAASSGQEHRASEQLFLHPFGDQRLYGDFEGGQLAGGRIDYLRAFVLVAGFVLLIACVNFMNLSTARSMRRAREVGVRKSAGATRGALLGQFLGESMLVALLGFVVAVALVGIALPGLNALTGKTLTMGALDPTAGALFLGIALATGLVAGLYPAAYLSSFEIMQVFRGTGASPGGHARLRQGLVVFQFALSILLAIGTLTIYSQVDYIHTKQLGLDKDHLAYTSLEGPLYERYDALKQSLERRPGIRAISASHTNPLDVGSMTTSVVWDGRDPDADIGFHYIGAHYDFVETMGLELLAGRSFSPEFGTDSVNVLINERAAEAMGLANPVGQRLAMWPGLPDWEQDGTIIGVVKDFHMASLHSEITPTIIRFDAQRVQQLFVRAEPGQLNTALESLAAAHAQFAPDIPFEYQLLSTSYDRTYALEFMIGRLAAVFAGLAVLIACLGLFGLAAFTAEQRTKEVGVRKVLGASVVGLVGLLSKDFVRLVGLAFLIAAPVAFVLAERMLDTFAYRTSIGVWVFVLVGVGALALSLLTVSAQVLRTALANPIRALRSV